MTTLLEAPAAAPAPVPTRRAGYAAALWALGYGTLALLWTVTGRGFPMGEADPNARSSLLRALSPEVGAPLIAAIMLTTAVVVLTMTNARTMSAGPRYALAGFGWLVSALLLLVIPDARLLAITGYAPMLIIGAPFGWPDVDYGVVFNWPNLNQLICVVGGVLVARATLVFVRRTAGACEACGRGTDAGSWTSAESVARWGRWATYVAAVIPVLYAVTRLAWLAHIPLGISQEMLDGLWESQGVWAGAGLGAFAIVGAVLTLGLVQRWGEVFPRWWPVIGGRRVPVSLAVVPATLVALMVFTASVSLFTPAQFAEMLTGKNFIAVAPMLLWPVWAVALGLATLAYRLRRRGACEVCERV